MKVAFFSTKSYDRQSFEAINANYHHDLTFFDAQLNPKTAVLAADFPAICMFVNGYEQEDELFFQDLSDAIIQDDTFQLLQSFPNVVITAHQAFFTRNALDAIATTTLSNITDFEQGQPLKNEVVYQPPNLSKVGV